MFDRVLAMGGNQEAESIYYRRFSESTNFCPKPGKGKANTACGYEVYLIEFI